MAGLTRNIPPSRHAGRVCRRSLRARRQMTSAGTLTIVTISTGEIRTEPPRHGRGPSCVDVHA